MAQTQKTDIATTPIRQVTASTPEASGGTGPIETTIQAEPLTFDRVVELLSDKMIHWFDSAVGLLPNLLIAICVFIIFYAIGALVGRAALRAFNKAFDSQAVASLMAALVKVLVVAVGFFIALDLTVPPLLRCATIAGASLGCMSPVVRFATSASRTASTTTTCRRPSSAARHRPTP